MVVDNLIENVDIVFGKFNGYSEQEYICYYHTKSRDTSPYLLQRNNGKEIMFSTQGTLEYPRFQPKRIATLQEREWFLACIEAKKLVEKPLLKLIHELW